MQETLVVVQLLRVPNRQVVLEDWGELKAEAVLLRHPNRWVNSRSLEHPSDKCNCSTRTLDSLDSFLSLGQDSVPDLQAVPHPRPSAKEVTVVHIRDRNLDLRPSRLVVEDMAVRDRWLVPNLPLPEEVMVDRVGQDLRPDRNRSAADTIMERTE